MTERFDPRVVGLDHLSLAVAHREEVEDWGRHLDAEASRTPGRSMCRRVPILNFNDPDGIALAVFWDR